MDNKFSVLPTVRDHYATLIDQNEPDKFYWPDWAVLVGLPLGAGALVSALMIKSGSAMNQVDSYIAGVAIFTALLFALVIHVFQLRMQLDNDERVPSQGDLLKFVDQLFANVNYAVVAGVLTTATSMTAAGFAHGDRVGPVWAGVLLAMGLHLLLCVFMCVKRVRAAYREIKRLPRRTTSV